MSFCICVKQAKGLLAPSARCTINKAGSGRGRCLSGYGGSDAVGVGDAAGCSERRNVAGRKRPWQTLRAQGVLR